MNLPPPVDGMRLLRVRRERGVNKLLIALDDGAQIETVLIPMRTRPNNLERVTLCVSTQVGCRMGCTFCATGRMGFVRQLSAEEIVAQTVIAERCGGRRPDNLVFMGMGEPLDNLAAWREAVERLIASPYVPGQRPRAWSTHQMTVSTAGHVSGLDELAKRYWRQMTLAVSINAPNDELRSRLMPINRRWPLAQLMTALARFPLRHRTFVAEYVVFKGLNDSPREANELAELLRPFRALVNVIGFNPPIGEALTGLDRPTLRDVERFRRWLEEQGQPARLRESKGRRIGAACGQLAGAAVG